MAANVAEFTDASFETDVLKSDTPVLVDFWAPWCGPCRQLAPHVEAVAGELAGKLKVGKLNVDDNVRTAGAYQVQGIPTLLLFKGGKVEEQIVGYVSKDALRRSLDKHL
ncbi:MAG TPA: thioredoxin [Terriglobales bacterium]|nr:thioredoxin [Terriglobales bacterium]